MTRTLKDCENLSRNKVDISLVGKMSKFCEILFKMFPKHQSNIGEKYADIDKNLFLNDFLYGILADIPS